MTKIIEMGLCNIYQKANMAEDFLLEILEKLDTYETEHHHICKNHQDDCNQCTLVKSQSDRKIEPVNKSITHVPDDPAADISCFSSEMQSNLYNKENHIYFRHKTIEILDGFYRFLMHLLGILHLLCLVILQTFLLVPCILRHKMNNSYTTPCTVSINEDNTKNNKYKLYIDEE